MAQKLFILVVLISASFFAFGRSVDMLGARADFWHVKPKRAAFGFEEQEKTGASPGDFLVNDDLLGTGSQEQPVIARAPSGNFVIAWEDQRGSSQDIYARRYDSSGAPLGSNFKVNDDAGLAGQIHPAVAMDNSGSFIIAWSDDRNQKDEIYAQRYDPLGTPLGHNFRVNDTTGGGYKYYPAVAFGGCGNFVITWKDIYRSGSHYSDVYAQRYDSAGTPLGANFKVNDEPEDDWQFEPAVTWDCAGNFIITWEDDRNDYGDIYAQRYDSSGAPLGSNFRVNDDPGTAAQWFPTIAADGSGHFVIAWQDYRGDKWDVYVQRYDTSGTALGVNFKVNEDSVESESPFTGKWRFPAIAAEASGNFAVAWQGEVNGNWNIYAQRCDSSGSVVGSNFKVNDDAGSPSCQYFSPALAMDTWGNFVITWTDCRNHSLYPDIYAQRYQSSGTPLDTNFQVNDDAGNTDQEQPAIATNDLDRFVITWHDYRNDNSDIYAQRYDSSGNTLGCNFKINDDAGALNQLFPDVGMDSSGNFVTVWQDYRNDDWDVYAQRFDSSGAPLDLNFKVNDDPGTSHQESPAVTVDGSGNFVITWQDYRNGDCDIYAQRYDASGAASGSNFKVNDDAGALDQWSPAISSDGLGNFVIAWSDNRNGNYDIYVQRYNLSGLPSGSNFKVNDDAGTSDQARPAIASRASGSFVITWQDYRDDNFDIYLQMCDSSGAALGTNLKVNDDFGTAEQNYPAVASDLSGNFVIAWQDHRNENCDVYKQQYDSFGNPLGSNFLISDFNFNSFAQITPEVAIGSSKICFAWTDDRRAKGWDVYARLMKIVSGLRGDVNGNGEINLADVVYLINYLFWGGPAPAPELLVGDVNCDDSVGVVDVVYLINYLFKNGPPPC